MKTKGMRRMLLAAAAIAIAVTSNAIAQQGNTQHKYTDDAIVRDLKAGKLTVREAQILQGRSDPAAVKAKTTVQPAHGARPAKAGKAPVQKKNKAPVRHLTGPHDKNKDKNKGKNKPKAARKAGTHHAAAAHGQAARSDKSATGKPSPIRKTAVKYIR
ncbi:hypothetical protein [Herbaspirillum sp. RV1423]|uniref:hypothetical protein n=1 Tax=Herbaspirillum sp. RV1423 TaxID=1443993 RepID=UPI0004BAA65D|nr:hypothetical protein [Herbaspirillum sp. RV1423]